MVKSVQKCQLQTKNEITWEFVLQKDKAIGTKQVGEKKEFDKKVIMNLDIFFRDYDVESWPNLPYETKEEEEEKIIVTIEEKEYVLSSYQVLPEQEKNVFEELSRYFTAYFEETAGKVHLSYHSFDGGGPKYKAELENTGIVTWYYESIYSKANHEVICGAGYCADFLFYPLRKGQAVAHITGDSPICPEPLRIVTFDVDEKLQMTYQIEEQDPRRKDNKEWKTQS